MNLNDQVRQPGISRTLVDSWVIAKRNLMHIPRVPEKLADATVMPIMFVLLFAFVFGSAIEVPGDGGYREFLLPGVFVQTMAFITVTTATGMAFDMQKGLIDRFRSLPMSRSAVVVGRAAADLAQSTIGITVMSITGILVGWGAHRGILHTAAGFGVLLLFGLAMIFTGILMGLVVRTPETAQVIGFVVIFPMTFLSNTFVPTQGMTPVLKALAEWNPISSLVAALRVQFGNPGVSTTDVAFPLQHPTISAIVWSLAIMGVSMSLAIWKYGNATAR